jgi:hypothetical protein
MPKPKKKNGTAVATQHDLSLLAGEMTRRFDEVDSRFEDIESRFTKIDSRFDNIEKRLGGLERGQSAILEVVTSIDVQLRELKTLPDRVRRLER